MTKILIDGEDFGNRGFMAVAIGLTKALKASIPDTEIVIFSDRSVEYEKLSKYGMEVSWNSRARMGTDVRLSHIARNAALSVFDILRGYAMRTARKLNRHIGLPYGEYDVVIHYVLDWHTEMDSSAWRTIPSLVQLFIARMLYKRPFALLPSGMGPFNHWLTRRLAKFILNRMDIVPLREETSYNYLKSLNLSKAKVTLAGDMGFLLDPASSERVKQILHQEGISRNHEPLVGFTPNEHLARILGITKSKGQEQGQDEYVRLMTEMVDYIVERFDATVCLIPHVYDYDDKEICRQIRERVNHKEAVVYLRNEYLSDELKGVISSCDLFIGSWMHSTIASTSMGVPTLAIAFSDKFYRLFGKTMGQEEYIVNIRNQEPSQFLTEIKTKLDTLWINREKVKEELKARTKVVQQRAWSYTTLINELMSRS